MAMPSRSGNSQTVHLAARTSEFIPALSGATGWQHTVILDVPPRHQNNPADRGWSSVDGRRGRGYLDSRRSETRRSSPSTGWVRRSTAESPVLKVDLSRIGRQWRYWCSASGSDVENGVLPAGGLWGCWARVDSRLCHIGAGPSGIEQQWHCAGCVEGEQPWGWQLQHEGSSIHAFRRLGYA